MGLEVAHVLEQEPAQVRKGHVKVAQQVHGYLRWYGDTTKKRGYPPLAEAISLALYKPDFDN